MDFMGIGMMEVLFILLIAFLVFGPHRLPEIARGAGKAVREFKKYSSALTGDLKGEFEKGLNATTDTQDKSPQTNKETLSGPDVASDKTEGIQPQNPHE